MVDKYIKEEKWSPEEVLKRAKKWRGGKSGEISSGGQGGQYDRFVSIDANAMECPPGSIMLPKKDSAGKTVAHCINPNTGEEKPPIPKPKGSGKKKKKKGAGEGGDVTSPIDAGGTGTGPGGKEEKGKEEKPEKPTTEPKDGETKPDDKDKPGDKPDDAKDKLDSTKVQTSLSEADLEPFSKLDGIEVYWIGRVREPKGKRNLNKVLENIGATLYSRADNEEKIKKDDIPAAIQDIKEHISGNDWVLFPGLDAGVYFALRTRALTRPKNAPNDKRFWEYKKIPQQEEMEKVLLSLQKTNNVRDSDQGFKNIFQQLTWIRYVIGNNRNAPENEKSEWNKFEKEYYVPARDKALEIFKRYNTEIDKKDKIKTAIYNSFNRMESKFKNIFIPNNDEPVATDKTAPQQEIKTMNKNDIRALIKEAFTDKVYGQYPYSHRSGDEEEPKEDYMEEWKRFCMEMVQDKSKERAIAIAKLLVKDVELFEDVLDLAGQNQSVGSEILRKMQKSEEV